MGKKGFLIATSAGFAAAAAMPGAQAADMPIKAPRYVEPAASWAGWYFGAHAGAAWQRTDASLVYQDNPSQDNGRASKTGFIGGGQIGYNWQNGNYVFGLEGDFSGLGSKTSREGQDTGYQYSSRISWLSTVRGRFGLAMGNTMAYATAGVAFGGVKNNVNADNGDNSSNKTRTGWTAGGGLEHMLSRNWTIGLEALYVDLGKSHVNVTSDNKTGTFKNRAVIGRVKLNYKF
jgi:outer membrane immunogenic protein